MKPTPARDISQNLMEKASSSCAHRTRNLRDPLDVARTRRAVRSESYCPSWYRTWLQPLKSLAPVNKKKLMCYVGASKAMSVHSVLKTPKTCAQVVFLLFPRQAALQITSASYLHWNKPPTTLPNSQTSPKVTQRHCQLDIYDLCYGNQTSWSWKYPSQRRVFTAKSSKNCGIVHWSHGHVVTPMNKPIPAASDISTRSYRSPWTQLPAASCHARGRICAEAGRFRRTLAWQGVLGIDPERLALHPRLKQRQHARQVCEDHLPGYVGWEADHHFQYLSIQRCVPKLIVACCYFVYFITDLGPRTLGVLSQMMLAPVRSTPKTGPAKPASFIIFHPTIQA